MLPAHLHGFADELSKIAFNEAQAMRVAGLAKKLQLPKAASKPIGKFMGLPGAAPLAATQTMPKSVRGATNDLAKVLKASPQEVPQVRAKVKSMMGDAAANTGVTPFGGHIVQAPRSLTKIRKVMKPFEVNLPGPFKNPSSNRMAQGILKGHELDELRARPGLAARQFGHMSPDVILREHNRVATLGPQHADVKNYFQSLRNSPGLEGSSLMEPLGLKYGDSPRLSRHARRHISGIMDRKAVEAVSQGQRDVIRKELGLAAAGPQPATTVGGAPVRSGFKQLASKALSKAKGFGARFKLRGAANALRNQQGI